LWGVVAKRGAGYLLVNDLLQVLFEYRRLVARRDLIGAELSSELRDRLARLEALFVVSPSLNMTRKHARYQVELPASIRVRGRELAVTVTDLGGGGLRVKPAPRLPVGKKTTIFIAAGTGEQYAYEVAAGWVGNANGASSMGMPFVGIPRQMTPVPRSRTRP